MAEESKDNQEQNKIAYDEPIVISKGNHTGTVIWMHGLGDTGKGWRSTIKEIHDSLPYIKWILPTAPQRAITCNNGAVMNGWYDIESTQDRESNTYEGKAESANYIHSLISHEINVCKIPAHRIVVAGFSQGGAMSIYSGLNFPQQLAAIISCSGYLLDFALHSQKGIDLKEKKTPITMCHAQKDAVVPTEYAQKGYEYLKQHGCNVEWKQYHIEHNGGHWVIDKELDDVLKIIQTCVPKQK